MIRHKDWDINEHATGRFKKDPDTGLELPIMGATFQNGLNDIEPDGFSFVPCDTGISKVQQGVTHLEMNRGRMGELRFGDSSHPNGFLVKIKDKGLKGISFKYIDSDGESMTSNNGKPLCNFSNGITIESTPYYKGVKMDIIVNDPLTAPTEYNFSSKTYGQDYTVIEESNGLTFKGDDLKSIYIKPPYAVDANGDIGTVTIHYLGMENNLHLFKKIVDEAWLRQAAAPVRIDPDVTIDDDSGTLIDNMLSPAFPNNNLGIYPVGVTLNYGGGTHYTTLIAVDLSAITGVTVTTARFGLDIYLGTFNLYMQWHRVLVAWIEGTKNNEAAGAGEPAFNYRANPTAWGTAGCLGDGVDRQTIAEGNSTITGVSSDYHLDMSLVTVQAWIDNSANNHGIVVDTPNEVAAKYAQWRSSEAVSGNKPYFYMEYTEAVAGIPILRRRRGVRWM